MGESPNCTNAPEPLRAGLAGLAQNWWHDLLSGFLVFLIALPLCLGISLASGFPAHAGILTAVVGGVVCTLLSNSQLTIKGPAAGLIVIVYGAVLEFGGGPQATPEAQFQAYHMALGIVVAAGVLQVLFGLLRAGSLGDFFPTSVVHGMLAAIGIIIAAKQVHVLLGVKPEATEPLHLLAEVPHSFHMMNPEVALIGGVSLLLLFGLPLLKNRWLKLVPAPMVVLLVAVPLGMYFDLEHPHTYTFLGHDYALNPRDYLVDLPGDLEKYLAFPDFGGLLTASGWKWVLLFALIGSLESLLSAKAIDLLDPWRRKTDLNRDLVAVGAANTLCGLIGGLPMISEIVRSSANRNNGARTKLANLFHGLFLAAAVAFLPWLVHQIPLAALAAMLVYTGWRLASPKEWAAVYKVGREQLVIFTATVVVVLATDLLVGIAAGIAVKFLIHWLQSAPSPAKTLVMPDVTVEAGADSGYRVTVRHAAIFSNWLGLKKQIASLNGGGDIILDLSMTCLVDHTVMEKLHELEREFEEQDRRLIVTGLDGHSKVSDHPHAARKRLTT